MRKRIVIAMVTGLVIASLAGCGTQADATNQSPESSSAVESEAGTESEAEENTEDTAETGTDESMSSEVVGDNTEEPSEFAGAENESIVLYAEKGEQNYVALDDSEYESHPGTVSAIEDVPIYNNEGFNVGYIKSGSTVAVTEFGQIGWTRFENPLTEADYDYLYVLKDYVKDGNAFTPADVEGVIKEELANRTFDAPIYTDVTDDMELYEFRVPSVYFDDMEGLVSEIRKYFQLQNQNEKSIYAYKTYAIVCTEDTDGYIICQVYYKDEITDEDLGIFR